MARGLLARMFGRDEDRDAARPLYAAIIAEARRPHWYTDGGVEDSINGRFEMIAAVFALVTDRLEQLGEPAREPLARVTECFVEDMDGQLRESGVGDVVIGKRIGKLMGALGGRLSAYRDGLNGGDLDGALARNLYRGEAVEAAQGTHAASELRALHAKLSTVTLDMLVAGTLHNDA